MKEFVSSHSRSIKGCKNRSSVDQKSFSESLWLGPTYTISDKNKHVSCIVMSFTKHIQVLVVISVSPFHQELHNFKEKEHEHAQWHTVFHNMRCLASSQPTEPPCKTVDYRPRKLNLGTVHCVESVCLVSLSLSLSVRVSLKEGNMSSSADNFHLNHC